MFLSEPQRTQYDINFSFLGFPIRVTPFFWVMALVLGYNLCKEQPVWLFFWIAAVFVSILVHELGHAFAFRRYSIASQVVLYHFGGLAVPTASFSGRGSGHLDSKQQIVVSAAGPAMQLLLAAMVYGAVRLSGYSLGLPFGGGMYWPLSFEPLISSHALWGEFRPLPNEGLMVVLTFLCLPSVYWALLNLLPVYPLDGGQIARELFTMSNAQTGIKNSLILSVATGAGLAIYAVSRQDMMLAILFGMLAFSSFQALQAYTGGGGYGGWRGGGGW